MENNPVRLASPVMRARLWYALLLVIFGVFVARLFYLQVIRHDYYTKLAANSQFKEYEVQAPRGTISAHLGDATVPLVLNQKLFTLYADPTLVKHPDDVAEKLQRVLGGNTQDIEKSLRTKDTRYVVVKKKLSPEQSEKVLAYKFPGVGTQQVNYRTYPQGTLAAQTLGFVNDEGQGNYGVEGALNKALAGKPGELKAVTDINGVPLAANSENLSVAPEAGEDLTLTLDMGMQAGLEKILATQQARLKAKQLNAVIMDPNTGAIKAMANIPTFDPAKYQDVDDASVFQNGVYTNAIEPGSVMKPLTAAAALDTGAVGANTTYFDPAQWVIDGFTIKNIEEDGGSGTQSVKTILNLSLNTGATWFLMRMGGSGDDINSKGRTTWYNYLTDHYQFGKTVNPELGYQAEGTVKGPKDDGAAIDLTYANMTFGQAMSATALQMAGALSATINGGTYYQPYLVDQKTGADGKTVTVAPKAVKNGVVSQATSNALIPMMEYTVKQHYIAGASYLNFGDQYSVGGKTGTAQIQKNGKYVDDNFNGTYVGFVGGDKPQYVIAVYAIEPQVKGYAGSQAGQPIFGDIAHMLINNFGVAPKD